MSTIVDVHGNPMMPAGDISMPTGQPKAAYLDGNNSMVLAGFQPVLREQQEDISEAWLESASKAIHGVQNSGFLSGAVETLSSAAVGSGLRISFRPDHHSLGWGLKQAREWSRKAESLFRSWADSPVDCDASGKMTFNQMQQAQFTASVTYGESLCLLPIIKRKGSEWLTKVSPIPPSRLLDETDSSKNIFQGVEVNNWGYPIAYHMRERKKGAWNEIRIAARDRQGKPNVVHTFSPGISTTRGISDFAPILKVARQIDQYADATLTKAMIQTIFAATIETDLKGITAFEGLMTNGDHGALNLSQFAAAKGEWHEGSKIDLSQHGRLAHLMPNEKLNFTESTTAAADYDRIMQWLMREIAMCLGVTYDSVSGDDRGATYSSIRMGSAKEWLKVERRRKNNLVPFCKAVVEAWLDEAIFTGKLEFPGGYEGYMRVKHFVTRFKFSGPAKPQADDYKTARAFEVRADIQATTLAEISDEYGNDWDDDAYQRHDENELHRELGLPLPWTEEMPLSPTGEGEEKDESGESSDKGDDRKRTKKRRRPGRPPSIRPDDRPDAELITDDGQANG